MNSEIRGQPQVQVRPLAEGQDLHFTIKFSNLAENELALLCAAITPSESFEHRLGMGRPLGLGSIKLSVTKLMVRRQTGDGRHFDTLLEEVPAAPIISAGRHRANKDQPKVWQWLLKLGEPANIQHPVHYPQEWGEHLEGENFKWWMKNKGESLAADLALPQTTSPEPKLIQPTGGKRR